MEGRGDSDLIWSNCIEAAAEQPHGSEQEEADGQGILRGDRPGAGLGETAERESILTRGEAEILGSLRTRLFSHLTAKIQGFSSAQIPGWLRFGPEDISKAQ